VVLNVFPEEKEKLLLPAFLSVGLHPWHVHQSTWENGVNMVEEAAKCLNVIAIGETGLDKAIDAPINIQRMAFEQQLHIAEKSRKAMIIHCVRSYSEMLSYRKKSDMSLPWIFHWFNADEQIAGELIRKNCFLSFGHMLFNEKSKAYRIFKTIPGEYVFFETDDSGYSISEVYERASDIRGIPVTTWQERIMQNFNFCFNAV